MQPSDQSLVPGHGLGAIISTPVAKELRFLFIAEFDDGSQYAQTNEDKSQLDLVKNDDGIGKSAFYDVLVLTGQIEDNQPERVLKITRFHLTDKHNWFTVDLRDGKFEVNGLPFETYPQNFTPTPPLKLIYFREHRADLYTDGHSEQYINKYYLGWWCINSNGEKVEYTIAVA